MAFTRPEDRATQGCDPSAARGFAKERHLSMLLFLPLLCKTNALNPGAWGWPHMNLMPYGI